MIQDSDALVLEVSRQDEQLVMSISQEKDLVQTIRHYGRFAVSFSEINKLCQEVMAILNKADKKGILEPNSVEALKKTSQILWDHLLTRPVKDRLKSAIIKDLVLSIDEELTNIPWELLYTGEDFLCLKFNLGRVVRTKERITQPQYRSLKETPKMLILANPTSDLKSAYLEGVYIKDQFDRRRNQISIDFKSTCIDNLYVKKNLRDYDIVHFAGHCEYDTDNPKATGWVLSDGRFTASDILALGESLSLPSMVFSNACHSAKVIIGLRDTDYREKNYSMASAFLFSGVRHYIGTIWKIEDPLSMAFAKEFYAQLIKGNSVGECVRLSRIKLIKEYGIGAISWASYLLYGNPNFRLFKARPKPAALKFTRAIPSYKKLIARLTAVASIIIISIYLYLWLPTINPTTYFSFLRSHRLYITGDNQKVILFCSELLKKEPSFLAAYPLLADTYSRLGDRNNALKYYFEYARYSEKRNDQKSLSSAYIGIGRVYQEQGMAFKAFDFYHKALSLSKESKDKLNEAVALRKLAVWHMDYDEYDKALELLTKSSEINRQRQHISEHRYNLACDYFDIGLVFTNKDDFTTAKEFYAKSRALFEKLKLKNELSDYYFNMGEMYLFEKQYEKALNYYSLGLKIDEKQVNKPSIASDYNMLGELYLEIDNWKEAERFFKQSVLVSQEIGNPPQLADAYYNLGLLHKKKGQKNKAREYLKAAQEIYLMTNTLLYQEIQKELLELNNPE